jgi:hypothetical protein
LFPTLKYDKNQEIWHRSFKIHPTAKSMSEVLDEAYVPNTADYIALLQEKQKYEYTVLERKVLADCGKAIIWDHCIN